MLVHELPPTVANAASSLRTPPWSPLLGFAAFAIAFSVSSFSFRKTLCTTDTTDLKSCQSTVCFMSIASDGYSHTAIFARHCLRANTTFIADSLGLKPPRLESSLKRLFMMKRVVHRRPTQPRPVGRGRRMKLSPI
jgi:hypothetical protein